MVGTAKLSEETNMPAMCEVSVWLETCKNRYADNKLTYKGSKTRCLSHTSSSFRQVSGGTKRLKSKQYC